MRHSKLHQPQSRNRWQGSRGDVLPPHLALHLRHGGDAQLVGPLLQLRELLAHGVQLLLRHHLQPLEELSAPAAGFKLLLRVFGAIALHDTITNRDGASGAHAAAMQG